MKRFWRFWARCAEQGMMIRRARAILEELGKDTAGQPTGEIQGMLMEIGLAHLEQCRRQLPWVEKRSLN